MAQTASDALGCGDRENRGRIGDSSLLGRAFVRLDNGGERYPAVLAEAKCCAKI